MTDIEKFRKRRASRILSRLDAKFEESDHPRDENGRFTSGGGSGKKADEPQAVKKTTYEKTTSKYRQKRNDLAKKVASEDDGTFDLDTGKPVSFDKGFQVSFQTTDSEEYGSGGFMKDRDYDRAVDDLSKRLGSKPYMGRFGDPEISFHAMDYNTAMELATKYNQHSIWNWETMDIEKNPFFDESKNHVKR